MKSKRNLIALTILFLISQHLFAEGNFKNVLVSKTVVFYNDTARLNFVDNRNLFKEGWDTLAQPKFWQNVICLSPDSCIINSAEKRQSLCVITNDEWRCQEESEKSAYRDYLKSAHGLDNETSINVTTGKKEFYEYRKVIPLI